MKKIKVQDSFGAVLINDMTQIISDSDSITYSRMLEFSGSKAAISLPPPQSLTQCDTIAISPRNKK